MKEQIAALKKEKQSINNQIKAVKQAYKQEHPGWFTRRKQRAEQALYLRLQVRYGDKTEAEISSIEQKIDSSMDKLEGFLDAVEAKSKCLQQA